MSKRFYGWKRDLPKVKQNVYDAPLMAALPSIVDLENECPPVYDQGTLGSCTANAAASLAQFIMKKDGYKDYVPSRLALYWWNRFQENSINEDSGASLHDAINTLVKYGVPNESLWNYDINKFKVKPPKPVWSDGYWHSISSGLSVKQDINIIKARLAEGYPIIFGFTVYESFESKEMAKTGIMKMPKYSEKVLGGHAVTLIGFNDSNNMFKVRNSWGDKWGKQGYFLMPYNFLINPNYCDDFWTANSYIRFKK